MARGTSLTPGQAGALGFASSALNTWGQYESGKQNIKNTGEAARANIGYAYNDYVQRSNIAYEQQKAIQREVGDMMSQRGLEALQAEGRLRTAGASTGISGSSVEEVVAQAGYDEVLDNQIIIARGRSNIVDTFRSRLAAKMDQKAINLQATQTTKNNLISNSQVMMQSLSAGISTATTAITLGGLGNSGTEAGATQQQLDQQQLKQFDALGYNSIYN